MVVLPPSSPQHKIKRRQPVGWMGPASGSGLTSRGKGRWDVIDSQGTRIAAGFDTREKANRWIDSFNLLQAGYQLNDHDHEWFSWHWLSWLPKRDHSTDQSTKVPTVTGDHLNQTKVQAVTGDHRQ
jgi:hypothetical protein